MSILLAVLLVAVVCGVAVPLRLVALHRRGSPGGGDVVGPGQPAPATTGSRAGAWIRDVSRPVESSHRIRAVNGHPSGVRVSAVIPATVGSGSCDRCPAGAAAEVLLSSGSRLQLCGHHSREFARPLRAAGAMLVESHPGSLPWR